MRWRQYGIVGFVLLIAVLPGPRVAGAEQAPTEATAPEVGALAPDFVLPDLNGTPRHEVMDRYRVTFIPTPVLIDRQGRMRSIDVGPKDWQRPDTWRVLEPLLTEP